MNYHAYLKSAQWSAKRQAKLTEANFCCQKCKRRSNLQVHHLTYERLGSELLTDLQVLCDRCHEKAHNLFPAYVDDWKPTKKGATPKYEKPVEMHPLFKYVKPLKDGRIPGYRNPSEK
jgi:5-methylcytosine-specific restriction endonuclease McrA